MVITRKLTLTIFILTFAALSVPGWAQAQSDAALTNGDVVKMLDAGIPKSVVVRKIQVSETSFVTSPEVLIALKRQHVPDDVLAAMVESQTPVRGLMVEPGEVSFSGLKGNGHTLHPLPNVDASFRLDSKTAGKVQIRKNQIKVEKAGVPLFSVSWKDAPAK